MLGLTQPYAGPAFSKSFETAEQLPKDKFRGKKGRGKRGIGGRIDVLGKMLCSSLDRIHSFVHRLTSLAVSLTKDLSSHYSEGK